MCGDISTAVPMFSIAIPVCPEQDIVQYGSPVHSAVLDRETAERRIAQHACRTSLSRSTLSFHLLSRRAEFD